METLNIKGMKFRGFHGVHAHEKKEGNDFEVDVIIDCNLSEAAKKDDLSATIDYVQIEAIAKQVMEGPSVNLIEHLALQLGSKMKEMFALLNEFEVRIRKLNPPIGTETDYTEVRMRWPR
ncbi:MAG: dihydroneopterin aldolase [Balneolaceae bacterium]|nr:dihydroneopterin aldolase [Balneolaceae bacterium]